MIKRKNVNNYNDYNNEWINKKAITTSSSSSLSSPFASSSSSSIFSMSKNKFSMPSNFVNHNRHYNHPLQQQMDSNPSGT